MKYILFAGGNYYPDGGAGDIIGRYPDIESAMTAFNADQNDWCHIYEVETGTIIENKN